MVTSGNPPPSARLISAEAISPEQQKWTNELIKLSGSRGVTVGALLGVDNRDTRPLLLVGGKTWLLRSTRGSGNLSAKQLYDFYQRLAATQLLKDISWGLNEGVFWVRRTFYQGPLDLRLIEGQREYSQDAVNRLVRTVRDIHRADLVHGHICTANIAFNAESAEWPALVDFGFGLAQTGADLAGLNKARAEDVAGLAAVIEDMLTSETQGQYRALLDRMRNQDWSKRPTMLEVAQVFLPSNSPASNFTAPSSPGAVKSGRFIGGAEPVVPKAERIIPEQGPPVTSPAAPVKSAKPSARNVPPQRLAPTTPVEKEPTPELESHMAIPDPGRAGQGSLLGPLFVLFFVLIGVFFYKRWHDNQEAETPPTDRFAEYWASNQRSLMSKVADSAVSDHDQNARLVIASDALKGIEHPGVQTRLIKLAFNPAWEAELSEPDRQIVMGLALYGIVSEPPEDLPPLTQAHPALAFALAASLPIDSKADPLRSIPVSSLARLPQPYGPMFSALDRTGTRIMSQTSAKALAHILSGDVSVEMITLFLGDTNNSGDELTRLTTLLSLSKAPDITNMAWDALAKRPTELGQAVAWFENDKFQHWEKTSKTEKLVLISGNAKLNGMQFEQLTDLLLFPLPAVRQAAASEFLSRKMFGEQMAPTLQFIAGGKHTLTRAQVVSLLSALKLEGESQFAYIAKWFASSPPPESVLGIVLARKNVEGLDPFNVEAARYLQKKTFKTSVADYKIMIGHPEPLIRSLAYARLNPADPKEAGLLRDMAQMEPSDKRRQLIEEKLKTAGQPISNTKQ